jgi:hypothetical protein
MVCFCERLEHFVHRSGIIPKVILWVVGIDGKHPVRLQDHRLVTTIVQVWQSPYAVAECLILLGKPEPLLSLSCPELWALEVISIIHVEVV